MRQWIVKSECNNLPTETFWNTKEEAEKTLKQLNDAGCGSRCTNLHKIIQIDTSSPRPEGKLFYPEDKQYY